MRPETKKRIDVNAVGTPLGGFGEAFSGLVLSSATPVSSESSVAVVTPITKPGRATLRRERAHRGGKTVIVVDDFADELPGEFIQGLARQMREVCGCGGTCKDRRIEIQGDQATKIRSVLEVAGFRVAGVR